MNRVQAFGHAVRARRRELGLTQGQLAVAAGLHINYVGFIERGASSASLDTVFALADALDTTAVDLMGFAEDVATRRGKR